MNKDKSTKLDTIKRSIEEIKAHPEQNSMITISKLEILNCQAASYIDTVKEVARKAPFKWVITQGGAGGYFLEEEDYNTLLVEGRIP